MSIDSTLGSYRVDWPADLDHRSNADDHRQDPGRYEVFIELQGSSSFERARDPLDNQPGGLNLDKIQRTGFLQFNVNIKGATIFVDDPIGLTPYNDAIEVDEGPPDHGPER